MNKYQVLLAHGKSRQVIWIETEKVLKKGMYYCFEKGYRHSKKYWEILKVSLPTTVYNHPGISVFD